MPASQTCPASSVPSPTRLPPANHSATDFQPESTSARPSGPRWCFGLASCSAPDDPQALPALPFAHLDRAVSGDFGLEVSKADPVRAAVEIDLGDRHGAPL